MDWINKIRRQNEKRLFLKDIVLDTMPGPTDIICQSSSYNVLNSSSMLTKRNEFTDVMWVDVSLFPTIDMLTTIDNNSSFWFTGIPMRTVPSRCGIIWKQIIWSPAHPRSQKAFVSRLKRMVLFQNLQLYRLLATKATPRSRMTKSYAWRVNGGQHPFPAKVSNFQRIFLWVE